MIIMWLNFIIAFYTVLLSATDGADITTSGSTQLLPHNPVWLTMTGSGDN